MWYKRRSAEAVVGAVASRVRRKADEEDRCIFCGPEEGLLVRSGERALVL